MRIARAGTGTPPLNTRSVCEVLSTVELGRHDLSLTAHESAAPVLHENSCGTATP